MSFPHKSTYALHMFLSKCVILRTMKPREIPDISKEAAKRFWKLVDKTSNCWMWTGSVTKASGFAYGAWSYYDYSWKAHRIAYTLKKGPIPEGLTLDHLCRNKLCVNPSHLEPVTQSVNSSRTWTHPDRLYSLTCPYGHPREFGRRNCRRCMVRRVSATNRKYPEKYREMRRLQRRKERARKAAVVEANP